MSTKGATALYERINSDEAFRTQLEAAETSDDKRRIATEAGYDVNRDDLSTVRNLAGVNDLSDEDLEKVAGGMGDTTGMILTSVGVVACAVGAAL
jgi:predicted ribosomally synthesized peptide with nif11-like leader